MMTNPTGRLTQGQFSFLPDLTDEEIALQIDYGLRKGYRGRFGMYLPPLLEQLGLIELEHNPRNNRARALPG